MSEGRTSHPEQPVPQPERLPRRAIPVEKHAEARPLVQKWDEYHRLVLDYKEQSALYCPRRIRSRC